MIDATFDLLGNNRENRFLSDVMKVIRAKRPWLEENAHFTVSDVGGGIAQIWIQTPACRYSQLGRCTICNYWKGNHISNVLDELVEECIIPDGCDTLLINTCGSCLDQFELSLVDQEKLWDWIRTRKCHNVILETHADMLSLGLISRIRDRLSDKDLYFEIGIESISKDVLFYCLNKDYPKIPLKKIVNNVHAIGGKLIANVVLGAPFLNRTEQVEDAVNSINVLLRTGVDYITLFPVNLKPYTLTEVMYRHGMYELVTGNMIIEVLSRISGDCLPKVNLSWYGNRLEKGLVAPYYCPKCQKDLKRIIEFFNNADSKEGRLKFFEKMRKEECVCRHDSISFFNMTISKRIECGYFKIKEIIHMEGAN